MKKLLSILFTLVCAVSLGQNVTVVGPISTNGTTLYPTHYDSLQKGGFRVATDTTERNSITQLRRKYGMLVATMSDSTIWQLRDPTLGNNRWVSVFNLPTSNNIVNIVVNGAQYCFYQRDEVPVCFNLGRFYDSSAMNFNRTYLIHYNNGNIVDSVRIPHTYLQEGDGIRLTAVDGNEDTIRVDATGSPTDTSFKFTVIDSLDAPPDSVEIGDIFEVSTLPTLSGLFFNHATDIAIFDGIDFQFEPGIVGDLILNARNGVVSKFTPTNVWRRLNKTVVHSPFDRYGMPLSVGTADSFSVIIGTKGVPRMTIDRTTNKIELAQGVGINFNTPLGQPSKRISWEDESSSIGTDGGGTMQFKMGVGRFTFQGDAKLEAYISQYYSQFYAPVSVGNTPADIDKNAILDLQSTTGGLLMPRFTTAQMVYNSSDLRTGTYTPGSGYVNGTYFSVAGTGGSGTGATFHITVAGGVVAGVVVAIGGRGFAIGDVLSATVPGGGTGFTYTVTTTGSPGMTVYNTDSSGSFEWTGTAWHRLYNTGGGGGGATPNIQQVYEVQPFDPGTGIALNGHGNDFNLDSVNFNTAAYNDLSLGLINSGASTSQMANSYNFTGTSNSRASVTTTANDSTYVAASMFASTRDYLSNLINHSISVKPDNIKFEGSGSTTRVFIPGVEVMAGSPTYIYGSDNDTIKKYAYSGGGGVGNTIYTADDNLTGDRSVGLNGKTFSLKDSGYSLTLTSPNVTIAGDEIQGVAHDSLGNIYVIETNAIRKYDANYNFISENLTPLASQTGYNHLSDGDVYGSKLAIITIGIPATVAPALMIYNLDLTFFKKIEVNGGYGLSAVAIQGDTAYMSQYDFPSDTVYKFGLPSYAIDTINILSKIVPAPANKIFRTQGIEVEGTTIYLATDQGEVYTSDLAGNNFKFVYKAHKTGNIHFSGEGIDVYSGTGDIRVARDSAGINLIKHLSPTPTKSRFNISKGFLDVDLQTSINANLDLNGSLGMLSKSRINFRQSAGSKPLFQFYHPDNTNYVALLDSNGTLGPGGLYFLHGGLVGINKVNPAAELDVVGAIKASGNITATGLVSGGSASKTSLQLASEISNETGTSLLVYNTSPTIVTPNIAAINGGTSANLSIRIQGTTNAVRASSYVTLQENGGFVGIGTATPQRQLDIKGASGSSAGFNLTDNGGQTWAFLNATTGSPVGAGNFGIFDVTAAATRFVITPTNGYVGVGGVTAPHSTLNVAGSFAPGYVSKNASYTATAADYTIRVAVTGQTITLPTAVGIAGRIYIVKLVVAGTATVATTSSQTIDGSTTYSLGSQYKYVQVQSDGANYFVIGNNDMSLVVLLWLLPTMIYYRKKGGLTRPLDEYKKAA